MEAEIVGTSQAATERDALLGGKQKKPFYRARPLWIVPFVVTASLTRGMTLAPRVDVFTQLSCNAIYGHPIDYNHTSATDVYTNTVLAAVRADAISPFPRTRGPVMSTVRADNSSKATSLLSNYIAISDDDDDDPTEDPTEEPSKRCLSDPKVQAGAARLQTIMTTTMGFLSALTTGWWGHFGERHGRTRVLAVSTLGLVLTDLIFVLVSMPRSPFAAHGHRLLIISPIIEGLLGGWSTLQGGATAYVSDCTSDGSRSHIFSRFNGVFYVGFSLGPMLGAFIIAHPPPLPFLPSHTHMHVGKTVTPVFWIAVLCSLVNLFLAIFVFPESLTKEKRLARQAAEAEAAPAVDDSFLRREDVMEKRNRGGLVGFVKGFFAPLKVFAPRTLVTANGRARKDWSMTLLAFALLGYLLSTGIFQIKYLYAEHVYGWGAEQLSYYITFVGGARAVYLLFIMPFLISVYKPRQPPVQPGDVAAEDISTAEQPVNTGLGTQGKSKKPKPTQSQLAEETAFDLSLARLSYGIDILSHTLVSLSSTAPTSASQLAFVAFTTLSSLGSGVLPIMQSLGLCILQGDELLQESDMASGGVSAPGDPIAASKGALFGAFALLQASGSMVLGPMIFGLVYSTTVAQFPKTIFVVAASTLLISVALLALLRPPIVVAEARRRRMLLRRWALAMAEAAEGERGRSRVSKDLSGLAYTDTPHARPRGPLPEGRWHAHNGRHPRVHPHTHVNAHAGPSRS